MKVSRCPSCRMCDAVPGRTYCGPCDRLRQRRRRHGEPIPRAHPNCLHCGARISHRHAVAKFCDEECRRAAYREKRQEVTRRAGVKYRYGRTPEEVVQALGPATRCAICGRAEGLHIDHDHRDGRLRGWLCGPCNRALGLFGDDPAVLQAAANYLLGSPAANE